MWLLNYEFPDSLIIVTKEKIVFVVGAKKSKLSLAHFLEELLEKLEEPANYSGLKVEIILRNPKGD
jgi:nucleosome binding factor SPN SPT16 subunit